MTIKTIGVTAFKAKCLGFVDEIARSKTAKVVLTRRGKPVAELRMVERKRKKPDSSFGALKGMLKIDPDFDLTTPTSELIGWNPDDIKLYNE